MVCSDPPSQLVLWQQESNGVLVYMFFMWGLQVNVRILYVQILYVRQPYVGILCFGSSYEKILYVWAP